MKTLARPEDKAEILRRLRELSEAHTRRWGRMSVQQMVCHLADCFRMATGDKPVRDASNVVQRTVVKWFALYAPLRWPSGIATRPELDQMTEGTAPDDFACDVACVQELVDRIARDAGSLSWAAHPLFGPMSTSAWLRWGYLHVDHHLRQFGA
jgi:hypothetical protein